MLIRVPAWQDSSPYVRGAMKFAWGSDTGKQHHRIGSRGKGGLNTVGSPATRTHFSSGADTAVSIEREVVSGHAYAILAP
jgi:hypothetical protein